MENCRNFNGYPPASELDENGNVIGHIYGGSIPNIAEASATFCLELAARYPEEYQKHTESSETIFQTSDRQSISEKYRNKIITGVVIGVILLIIGSVYKIYIEPLVPKPKPNVPVKVKLSLLEHERAFTLTEKEKIYYWQMRNLATQCNLWNVWVKLPRNRAVTPEPEARIFIKILLENVSSDSISNLRIGVRLSPIKNPTLSHTPNIEANILSEFPSRKTKGTTTIKVNSLQPKGDAILTLEAKITPEL